MTSKELLQDLITSNMPSCLALLYSLPSWLSQNDKEVSDENVNLEVKKLMSSELPETETSDRAERRMGDC